MINKFLLVFAFSTILIFSFLDSPAYSKPVFYKTSTVNTVFISETIKSKTTTAITRCLSDNFFLDTNSYNELPFPSLTGVSPTIITGSAVGGIIACAGTASSAPNILQFTVSGTGLNANITATAPSGFEISLTANNGYSNSISIVQYAGVVANTTIYVRSAASAPVGLISGNVVIFSAGSNSQNVAVNGTIYAIPTVNQVVNQTVFNGKTTNAVNFTGNANLYKWTNDTPGIGLTASGTGDIAAFNTVNNTDKPIKANITVTPSITGFAYLTNQQNNTLCVVNTSTNQIVATIPVGDYPYGVSVTDDGSRVYVYNMFSADISVINTSTNKEIVRIPLNKVFLGYSSKLVVSHDGNKVYVAWGAPHRVVVIDTQTNTVVDNISTGDNTYPYTIAISPDDKTLYITDTDNEKLIVMNTQTKALSFIKVGQRPAGIAASKDGTHVYVVNGGAGLASATEGSYTVINTATNSVISTVVVGNDPQAIALSPDGNTLYVSHSNYTAVSVYNTKTNTLITDIGSRSVAGLSISPDGKFVYGASFAPWVQAIDAVTNKLITTITLPNAVFTSFGNFVTAGSPCDGTPVTFSITVNPTPSLSYAGNLTGWNTSYGTPSPSESFTVSGTGLSAGILVTPPSGFEVSADNKTFSNTLTVGATGTVTPAQVYIRLAATTNTGNYTGNIVLTATGATDINIPIPNSTVTPIPITITANNVTKTYGTNVINTPISQAFFISGGSLKNGNNIISVNIQYGTGTQATDAVGTYMALLPTDVTGANGFLASNYTITYMPGNIIVTPALLTIKANDVYKIQGTSLTAGPGSVAFTETGLQNQETIGSITVSYRSGSEANDPVGYYPESITPLAAVGGSFFPSNYLITYVNGNITIHPPIAIVLSGVLSPLTTVYGTPSSSVNFNVSGTNLSDGILVTPPPGFEVSSNNLSFTPALTIGSGGNIASTVVYIRLTALTPVGSYLGNILLTSPGAANAMQMMPSSTVTPTNLIITADDKTKTSGTVNPLFTAHYWGFVNNETVANLINQPLFTTSATKLSPPGRYSIVAGGAMSPNYIINYVAGTLTITSQPVALVIPNTFTPNGDGVNDLWNISNLSGYTDSSVSIYNRYGTILYYSAGYAKPWDGTYNGAPLPVGTYYYLVKFNKQTLSGPVTILR